MPDRRDHPVSTRHYLAFAAVLVTVVAWASAFPLIRIALQEFQPLPLAATRFSLAAIVACAWLAMVRPKLPSLRDLVPILLCGLFGIALYNAFLNSGQVSVSPGAASFLVNTGPIIAAALATLFLSERFGPIAWIGSLVAFAGVAIIATGQPGGIRLGAGASLVLLAAACQATYFILQRRLVARYGAIACTAYTFIAGAILLSPWLSTGLESFRAAGLGSKSAIAVLALVVLPSIVGYVAWTFALGELGAARASNFLYLVPPTAVALSFALTGELVRPSIIFGGLLAIVGVAIVNLRRRMPERTDR